MAFFSFESFLIVLVLIRAGVDKQSLLRSTLGEPHMLHAPVVFLHESIDLIISRSEIRTTLDGSPHIIPAKEHTVLEVELVAAILIPA